MTKRKDLVQLIRDNPDCFFRVDNDWWGMYSRYTDDPNERDELKLATSGDALVEYGDGGYGSGNCYGGDILQALAAIVGVKVESV